jgi:hypothetical protein
MHGAADSSMQGRGKAGASGRGATGWSVCGWGEACASGAHERGKSNAGAKDDQRRCELGEISSIHHGQDFFPFLLVLLPLPIDGRKDSDSWLHSVLAAFDGSKLQKV